MIMREAILLLGSNLGDTEGNIFLAVSKLEKEVGKVMKKSKILKTFPVEFDSPYIFCNFAVTLETEWSPMKLLYKLKKIEKEMGRERDSKVYGEYRDRVIDIDVVAYDDMVFSCKRLEIPHYRHLYRREFSKILLREIGDWKLN